MWAPCSDNFLSLVLFSWIGHQFCDLFWLNKSSCGCVPLGHLLSLELIFLNHISIEITLLKSLWLPVSPEKMLEKHRSLLFTCWPLCVSLSVWQLSVLPLLYADYFLCQKDKENEYFLFLKHKNAAKGFRNQRLILLFLNTDYYSG